MKYLGYALILGGGLFLFLFRFFDPTLTETQLLLKYYQEMVVALLAISAGFFITKKKED